MQDLTGKVTGGTLAATEWNQVPQELQNVITDSGIALAVGDLDQVGKAVATYAAASHFLVDSGTSTAYVLGTVGNMQLPPAYVDGLLVRFRPGNTSTTTVPTVALGGLTAKTVKRENGAACVIGDLSTGRDAYLRFDATADKWFISLFSMTTTAPGGVGYINGMIHSNSVTNLLWDIEVSAGSCSDSTGEYLLTLDTATAKDTRINWSSATVGAKPSSRIAPNLQGSSDRWRVFVIGGPTVTTSWGIDSGGSSEAAQNLLATAGAGYTKFRQIGWIQTFNPDGFEAPPTHIIRFEVDQQDTDYVHFLVQGKELFGDLVWKKTTSFINQFIILPVPQWVVAKIRVELLHNSTDVFGRFYNANLTIVAPAEDDCLFACSMGTGGIFNGEFDVQVNGLNVMRGSFSRNKAASGEELAIKTMGYRYERSRNNTDG